jgi:GPH family glycoside/pentoside/hexuronide:cation symporter
MLTIWVSFFGTREQAEIQQTENVGLTKALAATLHNKQFWILSIAMCVSVLGLFGQGVYTPFLNLYYVFGGVDRAGAARVTAVAGTVTGIVNIAGAIFWGWVAVRFGKKRTFMAGLIGLILLAPLTWFLYTPRYPYLQIVYAALAGSFSWAYIMMQFSMLADICDIDELETGCRREGAYSGVMSFVQKLAFSLTVVLPGVLMKLVGLDEKIQIQPPDVIFRLRLLLPLTLMVTMGITLVIFSFFRLKEKDVREARAELDRRRAANETTPVPGGQS